MTRMLILFQIKTTRSAWTFLVGSGLLFLFNLYQAVIYSGFPSNVQLERFELAMRITWFVVTSVYMAIASWALFSTNGKQYIQDQEKIPIKGNRTLLWYIKFLFACYAASLATVMVLGVLFFPVVGPIALEAPFSEHGGAYLLFSGLIWSPLIFRYLK